MKNFFRTAGGKTLAFIACVLAVLIAAGSVLGAAACIECGYYEASKEELFLEITESEESRIIYPYLYRALDNGKNKQSEAVKDDGNLIFEIRDMEGELLLYSESSKDIKEWEREWYYSVSPEQYHEEFYKDIYKENAVLTVKLSIKEGCPENDLLALLYKLNDLAYEMRYGVYGVGTAALILAVIFFVILMNVSARKPESEELFPGALHKVPFDILLALFVFAAVVPVVAIGESDWARSEVAAVFILFIYGVGIFSAFLGLCMSAAARIKDRSLLKNTLIWRICLLLWKFIKWLGGALLSIGKAILSLIRAIPLVWKTGLALFAVYLIRTISLGRNPYDWALETLFEAAVIIPLILYIALCMRTLQKGGRALASGDLSYRVDTKNMLWDLKEHGENLNRISDGTALAVEERLKSERMKTELITNVSHDIKTPLTSIINYAGLIGEEETDNEKIKEYSEVLVRQSERLKRLIEDLVEASKASTGNLDVQLMPCDASVFLSQAAGEYEEKMADAELKLITVYPEKELRIMADGRRMQRVFDNLMNNICKYAQPGTRVYLSLEEKNGNAVFTFRNTSKEQLNISEEELMERFTRGDSSRNTEGNGLGLSIAKSMAELQKGSLKLSIDGDLFKAILSFPLI